MQFSDPDHWLILGAAGLAALLVAFAAVAIVRALSPPTAGAVRLPPPRR